MADRKKPMQLEEETQRFFYALGWAISRWSKVEDLLAFLFAFLTSGNAHSHAAKAAYYAAINFNVKLEMTQCASVWALDSQFKDEWKTLHNRIGRKSKRRNILVHYVAVRTEPVPSDGCHIHLTPSLGDVNALAEYTSSPPTLNFKEIEEVGDVFEALAAELGRFCIKVGALQPVQPRESL
ncbi:MAG TPA: hypothetical protein VKQ29_05620 [Aliidongia sp.]|nr:hypothetical protein [Aliidongia sp.]